MLRNLRLFTHLAYACPVLGSYTLERSGAGAKGGGKSMGKKSARKKGRGEQRCKE